MHLLISCLIEIRELQCELFSVVHCCAFIFRIKTIINNVFNKKFNCNIRNSKTKNITVFISRFIEWFSMQKELMISGYFHFFRCLWSFSSLFNMPRVCQWKLHGQNRRSQRRVSWYLCSIDIRFFNNYLRKNCLFFWSHSLSLY